VDNSVVVPAAEGAAGGESSTPLPSCTAIFDRFWHCATPGHQFQYYYTNGELEYCPEYLNDWTVCLKSQLVADEKRKREIMRGTLVMKPKQPNTIWALKESPSWDKW